MNSSPNTAQFNCSSGGRGRQPPLHLQKFSEAFMGVPQKCLFNLPVKYSLLSFTFRF